MLKKKSLDNTGSRPLPGPRHFDTMAGGQVGLWHEAIEQKFADQPSALPLDHFIAQVSRLLGPVAFIVALAGLIWLAR